MPFDVAFRWRTEPPVVGIVVPLRVGALFVPAAVGPLFVTTLIDVRLVEDLRSQGCELRDLGLKQVEVRVTVRGLPLPPLPMSIRSLPLPLRLEPGGARALVVLGMEFLSLYKACALRFRGDVATLTLGE